MDYLFRKHARYSAITAGLLLSALFASPALAADSPLSGFVEATWTVPTDTDIDSALSVEFKVQYAHDSGIYLGGALITQNFIDSNEEFGDDTIAKINPGYSWAATDAVSLDIGMTYKQKFDTKNDAYKELYLGSTFAIYSDLSLEAYFYKVIDADTYIELKMIKDLDDTLNIYGLLNREFQDSDGMTLELGMAKTFYTQHSVSGALIADLQNFDDSAIELVYTFNF